MKAPLPSNEIARLNALRRYEILDTLPEEAFDDLTRLAAQICQAPTALITFVDGDRQWFKSKVGLTVSETPRAVAFCSHTIAQRSLLIVPDTCRDERFVNNPLVTSDPKIRFYAGAPLITPDSFALGSLCAIDYVPRNLSSQQQEALEILARQVIMQLELRRNLAAYQQAIHQRQQIEQAHKESEERYRRLVELSPETIAVQCEGKFAYINRTGTRLLGASDPQEIIGKPILDFVHPAYREIVQAQIQQVQAEETHTELVAEKLVRLDGQVIDVEVTDIPITYRGKPATQVAIIDLTKRKQVEAALQESERKYQDLFENANDLIQSITPDGEFIYVNQSWQETLGYSEAEISQMKVYDIIHLDLLVHCLEDFGRVMLGEKNDRVETAFVTKDGEKIWVEGSINCQFVNGKPAATRGIFRNITERKQAEEALQKAYGELEIRVAERTAELVKINEQLRLEISDRQRAEEEVRLLQKITQAISESQNFHASLGVVLRQICQFTSWCFGEAWIPSPDGKVLQCSPAWYGSTESSRNFHIMSKKLKFPPATCIPGRVWSSRLPRWIPDLESESSTCFVRPHLASAAGFKAGLGIPIIAHIVPGTDPEVLAVLVFFMSESCEEDKRQVEIVSTVATQLGSLVQRKRAEEALRESEARYRTVVQQTSEGIFLVETKTKRILEANAAFANLLGYQPDEILGLTLYDIFALERQTIDFDVQRVVREKNCFLGETPHRRKDGFLTYAEVNVNFFFYGGREVFCVIAHDVTKRKRVEEALRESEERLQAILDNSTALIYVKDVEGRYILINSWFGILFDLDREEIKGKTDYDIFPKEIADVFRENDRKVLEAKTALDWEEVVPQDDGLHTYLSIKFPLHNSVGVPYAVCGISTDITERKRAEAEIYHALAKEKELGELKSRFVTLASHEFRTPLTTILSSAELLEDYGSQWSEEKKLQHLRRIIVAVKHMTQLLNDVLLIGKAEAGKLEDSPSVLDLTQFCHDLVEEMQIATNNHKIIFNYQCHSNTVELDEKLLRHVLSNLLSNAIKYSPAGGNVYFDLVCNQSEAIFCLRDEGIGIPELERSQLFDSFYRGSNVGTISGTGLGLAIVKRAVDLQGGKIAVESVVGVGTTFIVSLPLNK